MKYVSDLIVDVLRGLKIEYVALNPGATFRGIQDSIVNYGGNSMPELIECCHEEVAVAIAHGYAKAKGRPMACILHNIVGLLHGTMAIFNAWCDNAPLIVLGGTGPMDVEKRRPWIDWVHTALVQGNIVRDYTKWDDQPTSVIGAVESLVRAYEVAMTDPKGPVYVCFDVELQESELKEEVDLRPYINKSAPIPPQAEEGALSKVAELLVNAEMPVILADFLGRNKEAVKDLVELAELVSCPVIDLWSRMNFPNTHPLDLGDKSILADADVILALDVKDLYGSITRTERHARQIESIVKDDTKIVQMGLFNVYIRSLVTDYQRYQPTYMTVTCDTSVTLPRLNAMIKSLQGAGRSISREVRSDRFERIKSMHFKERERWREALKREWDKRPLSLPRLAYEIWEVIRSEDWTIGAGAIGTRPGWERRLWDIVRPDQYFGHSWGGGLGYCMPAAIGVALAMRGTGKLVIDLQPDGDLLYTASAIWTAAHHRIPILVVMINNRLYYNDWMHSYEVARMRERPVENARIGNELDNPPPDFATLARSFGCTGIGPIDDPEELRTILRGAVNLVKSDGRLVLVDVLTQPR
ncbi:MAG: thiamine pyrophosphate-binding protein [Aigarchaeota archaeon]|nr:thiamine pyrophosphate-binding protein [Aigarchaeota archaeon]MDW8092804.1 thiamine pyrophosphate-binding protein [Nitrososphaerota archaeon]